MVCVHSTSSRPELAYGFYAAYGIRLRAFIKRSAIQPLMASSPAFYLGTYLYKAALATRPNSSARGQPRSRLDLCEAKVSVLFKLYSTIQMKITSALCALFLAMETFALPINMPKGRSILAPRLVNTKRDEAQDGTDELRIPKESIKCLVGGCKDN